MKPKKTITQREIIALLQKHQDILKKYKVKRIGLFGSYATGKYTKRSDIDFLVEFEHPTFENFMSLINYLEKLYGRKVDILTPDGVESIRVKEIADNIKRSVVYA